jgi:hypothetical protein
MSDEKPFDLRDQFAAAAFVGFLKKDDCLSFQEWQNTYRRYSYEVGLKEEYDKFLNKRFEEAARFAYKAADVMRKVRLSAFE